MDLITSLTSRVMNKALDGLSKRHQAIASNLANVDTPHYKRRDVSFEGALSKALQEAKGRTGAKRHPASNEEPLAMQVSRPGHIPIGHVSRSLDEVQPEVTESDSVSFRNDGNSVDVETEMVQLAENTQRYLAISNLQSRTFRSIRSVITGGS